MLQLYFGMEAEVEADKDMTLMYLACIFTIPTM